MVKKRTVQRWLRATDSWIPETCHRADMKIAHSPKSSQPRPPSVLFGQGSSGEGRDIGNALISLGHGVGHDAGAFWHRHW